MKYELNTNNDKIKESILYFHKNTTLVSYLEKRFRVMIKCMTGPIWSENETDIYAASTKYIDTFVAPNEELNDSNIYHYAEECMIDLIKEFPENVVLYSISLITGPVYDLTTNEDINIADIDTAPIRTKLSCRYGIISSMQSKSMFQEKENVV